PLASDNEATPPAPAAGTAADPAAGPFADESEEALYQKARALFFGEGPSTRPKEWSLAWRALFIRPAHAVPLILRVMRSRRVFWLVLTLALCFLLFWNGSAPAEAFILIGVLLFHEAGHFLGMRTFGYRDVRMFFIPGFGAAVAGKKEGVPAWQEAIVLLLGPLPGLVLGSALYLWDRVTPTPLAHQ